MTGAGAGLSATPAAIEMVKRLVREHGPLVLFQSGGCCDGTTPICLRVDEMPVSPHDLRLGEVAGVAFYIDGEQYRRWGNPRFVVDVGAGAPEGFSLGLPDAHLVSRAGPARAVTTAGRIHGGPGEINDSLRRPTGSTRSGARDRTGAVDPGA